MAAPIGTRIRILGGGQVAILLQHDPEVESPVGLAALVGAAVGALGAGPVAALLEHDSEVACGRGVTGLVGAAVGALGPCHVAALFEQLSKPEGAVDRALIVRRPIRPFCNPPQTLDHP